MHADDVVGIGLKTQRFSYGGSSASSQSSSRLKAGAPGPSTSMVPAVHWQTPAAKASALPMTSVLARTILRIMFAPCARLNDRRIGEKRAELRGAGQLPFRGAAESAAPASARPARQQLGRERLLQHRYVA